METQIIKTLTYRNGDPIRTDFEQAGKDSQGAVKVVNDNYYYNWYAVNDPRGLALEGYEVPGIDDLMKIDNSHFKFNGYVGMDGSFICSGIHGDWWSASDGSNNKVYYAWFRTLIHECPETHKMDAVIQERYTDTYQNNNAKEFGFNVICVKNN